MYSLPKKWLEADKKLAIELGSDFTKIPMVPSRGWIDGDPLHHYMVEMLVGKDTHFFQREMQQGSWNLVIFNLEYKKQVLISQNRSWDSVERLLHDLAVFNKFWIDRFTNKDQFTPVTASLYNQCVRAGYRGSRNSFVSLTYLRNNIEPIIGFSSQLVIAGKLENMKY